MARTETDINTNINILQYSKYKSFVPKVGKASGYIIPESNDVLWIKSGMMDYLDLNSFL